MELDCLARLFGWQAAEFARKQLLLQIAHIDQQVGDRLVAFVPILAQCLTDDPIQLVRYFRLVTGQGGRIGLEQRSQDVGRSVPLAREGEVPGDHLVYHDAEAEYVGACVHLHAPSLLRRHVHHRPDDCAGLGEGASRRRRFGHQSGERKALGQLGETKVEKLYHAIRSDHDVLGFDVAVNDAVLVSGGECACDLYRHVESFDQ